jgi:hypothetical protein
MFFQGWPVAYPYGSALAVCPGGPSPMQAPWRREGDETPLSYHSSARASANLLEYGHDLPRDPVPSASTRRPPLADLTNLPGTCHWIFHPDVLSPRLELDLVRVRWSDLDSKVTPVLERLGWSRYGSTGIVFYWTSAVDPYTLEQVAYFLASTITPYPGARLTVTIHAASLPPRCTRVD